MPDPDVVALVPAAGSSARFGAPKLLAPMRGQPVLLWTLRALAACPRIRAILPIVPDSQHPVAELCRTTGRAELGARLRDAVPGGERRQDSVLRGLEALERAGGPDVVVIHDGARPLVTPTTLERSILLALETGVAVAAQPMTDTVKRVTEGERVTETVDRRDLRRVQTPQTFRFAEALQAYRLAEASGWEATDDAHLAQLAGKPVRLFEAEGPNLKITTTEDLAMAEAVLAGRLGDGAAASVGHGFDVHRFAEGRPLVLGGVRVPAGRGLAGHSDADVLTHAICDAILGALAAGDLGHHFPDDDPAWEGVCSLTLARRVAELAAERGRAILHVDATVIAQAPKLGPHRDAMRSNLSEALSLPTERISVKFTTTERLGFCGREEGIAAEAVCLIG